jgi:hypothetical protein
LTADAQVRPKRLSHVLPSSSSLPFQSIGGKHIGAFRHNGPNGAPMPIRSSLDQVHLLFTAEALA